MTMETMWTEKMSAAVPLYTTPELSLTVTALPIISVKKPEGSFADAVPFSILINEAELRYNWQGDRCQGLLWQIERKALGPIGIVLFEQQ